jgi:hypothetical protein
VLQDPEQPLTDQVYGVVPPVAVREVLYGLDTVPFGTVLGEVIVRGALELCGLWARESASTAEPLPHAASIANPTSGKRPKICLFIKALILKKMGVLAGDFRRASIDTVLLICGGKAVRSPAHAHRTSSG